MPRKTTTSHNSKITNAKSGAQPDFLYGVATAGFQIEGGFNGPGEPKNNWYEFEAAGRVEPSGVAVNFWQDYEKHILLAGEIGLNTFRLSLEWARLAPSPTSFDKEATKHYREILQCLIDRGLSPMITICHFTTPYWLGTDPWLSLDTVEQFANYASYVIDNFGDLCENWVTLNEINILALLTYVVGQFPPAKNLNFGNAIQAYKILTLSHIKAYEVIKRQQPNSNIATNNFCFSTYELDRIITDLLVAKSRGVPQADIWDWVEAKRATFYATIPERNPIERFADTALAKLINPTKAFSEIVDRMYASEFEQFLDVYQIDFYNPKSLSHIRLPGHQTAGGINWMPGRLLWDDPPNPEAFYKYLMSYDDGKLDIWVVENGMCNRVKNGRSYPRLDGWDRIQYLETYFEQIHKAILDGARLKGYWHWTLVDNYEWGSYEPRFGLYGVDRERGVTINRLDSMGYDSAHCYKALITKTNELILSLDASNKSL